MFRQDFIGKCYPLTPSSPCNKEMRLVLKFTLAVVTLMLRYSAPPPYVLSFPHFSQKVIFLEWGSSLKWKWAFTFLTFSCFIIMSNCLILKCVQYKFRTICNCKIQKFCHPWKLSRASSLMLRFPPRWAESFLVDRTATSFVEKRWQWSISREHRQENQQRADIASGQKCFLQSSRNGIFTAGKFQCSAPAKHRDNCPAPGAAGLQLGHQTVLTAPLPLLSLPFRQQLAASPEAVTASWLHPKDPLEGWRREHPLGLGQTAGLLFN